jgi:hypothetical protein
VIGVEDKDAAAAPQEAFQVVAGSPSDEELAALAAVLAAIRRARPEPHAPLRGTLAGGWRSYWHTVRNPLLPGREAWRSTFRR